MELKLTLMERQQKNIFSIFTVTSGEWIYFRKGTILTGPSLWQAIAWRPANFALIHRCFTKTAWMSIPGLFLALLFRDQTEDPSKLRKSTNYLPERPIASCGSKDGLFMWKMHLKTFLNHLFWYPRFTVGMQGCVF